MKIDTGSDVIPKFFHHLGVGARKLFDGGATLGTYYCIRLDLEYEHRKQHISFNGDIPQIDSRNIPGILK